MHVHVRTCGGSSNTERQAFHAALRIATSGPEAVVCVRLQVRHRQPAPCRRAAVQHRVAVCGGRERERTNGSHLIRLGGGRTGFMTCSFTAVISRHTHTCSIQRHTHTHTRQVQRGKTLTEIKWERSKKEGMSLVRAEVMQG